MDFLSGTLRNVSNKFNLPFPTLIAFLTKNRIYPDIIPFVMLGLLAKGTGFLSKSETVKSFFRYIKIDINIPDSYVGVFNTSIVKTNLIYELLYGYMLVALFGLFLKSYRSMDRVDKVFIEPVSNCIISLVIAYSGFLIGICLATGGDLNFSGPDTFIVLGPLGCYLIINIISHLLHTKVMRGRSGSFMPNGTDSVLLLFLSGALLRYGTELIAFFKQLSG